MIAVDGGASKTHLAPLGRDGALLDARPRPRELAAEPRPRAALARARRGSSTEAGAKPARGGGRAAEHVAASTSRARSRSCARRSRRARWARAHVVDNDTFAVLRAGTERGWGVAVVCGSGINCVGVSADGRHARFPALGADHRRLGRRLGRRLRRALGGRARRRTAAGRTRRSSRPCPRTSGSRRRTSSPRRSTAAASPRAGCSSCRRSSSPRRRSDRGRGRDRRAARVRDRRDGARRARAARARGRAGRGAARRRPAPVGRRAPERRGRGRAAAAGAERVGDRAASSPPIVGAALLGLDALGAAAEAQQRVRARARGGRQRRRRGGAMADVRYVQATKLYAGTDAPAVDALDLEIADGELMVLVGPSGLGQDDRAAHARRARGGRRGRDPDRRPRRHRPAAEEARHRDGLPELRALPVPDRRAEHRLPAQDGAASRRPSASAQAARGRAAARARAVPRPQARRSSPAASASASRWAARSSACRASS